MRVFRAPGRVNLIGDHTDYNEGFVMPMAIQLDTHVAITPFNGHELLLESDTAPAPVRIDLSQPLRPRGDWTDYVVGVAHVLREEGYRIDGARLSIKSTVPQGAGLSSSAALEVAVALAFLADERVDRLRIAQWCQRAENEFVGARCGIMDQYVACFGREGHALVIDCRTLESRTVPIPPDVAVIVSNSMVKHSIAGGEYNVRREQCEHAVRALRRVLPSIRSLRDLTLLQLNQHRELLSGVAYRRARHVIGENTRVQQAADALARHDFDRCGALMRESHQSLRDDYEVSVPELDLLVELAQAQPGVFGSRMTGGGFGGSTVTLADAAAADAVVDAVRNGYARETGKTPEVIVCTPSAGAEERAA
jgi:galactokinase